MRAPIVLCGSSGGGVLVLTPEGWLLGNVVGVATDSDDNVWIVHRPNSQSGAAGTPPVTIAIASWVGFGGGLPYDATARSTTDNALVLTFTRAGEFLLQIGDFGRGTEGSTSRQFLGQPTDIFVAPRTDEVYIADGYTNRRVVVFDATTGEPKRLRGAYGNRPVDDDDDDGPLPRFGRANRPPSQFNTPHCVAGADDGLIYVCDRGNERIQVFRPDGSFVQ